MENFEKLKRNMMWVFENKQEIPEEVLQLAQGMYNGLQEKYEQMGCNSVEIKQYMQENIEKLVEQLQQGIGDRRKEEQFQEIQGFLSGVEQKNQEQTRWKIAEFSNNKPNNIRTTLNTIDQIEKSLKDIQTKQKSILAAKGKFSESQISKMNDETLQFIANLRNENENKVYKSFQIENETLKNELLQAFDDFTFQGDK